MRYVIFGAGAIGSAIGAGLFEAGLPVVLIARGQHLEALREDGLTYELHGGTRQLRIPAVGTVAEADLGPGDTVFLCMKTQDTHAALQDLTRAATAPISVVCAQNGVENERLALRRFQDVYGLVVRVPAVFTEPGRVANRARPSSGILDIGRYPAGQDAVAERIAADLNAAGFDSRVQSDVMRWKYGKLMENLATPIDALFEPSDHKAELVRAVKAEAKTTLAIAGIDVPSDEEKADRRKDSMRYDPRKDPGRPGGSIWQSLARSTGSVEVDYLNGEIVLLGRLHGADTPVNEAVQRVTNELAREGAAPNRLDAREFLERLEGAFTP